ncbi:hypothetical protein PAXINDRAFT_14670, partial [Paxillus involutus ATCC 200175]
MDSGFLWLRIGLSDSASGYRGCTSGYRIPELTVFCHNLPTSWNQGKNKALNILKASQIHPSAYNFDNHFTSMSGINMLCVFGEARYPSINEEGDDAELEDIRIPSPSPTAPVPIIKEGDSGEEGDELPLTFEEAIGEVFDDTRPDDNADEYIELTSTPSTPTLPKGPGICPCNYLIVEGKLVHKASVVRLIVNKEFTPKSQLRLLRVRGFTPVNKKFGNLDA